MMTTQSDYLLDLNVLRKSDYGNRKKKRKRSQMHLGKPPPIYLKSNFVDTRLEENSPSAETDNVEDS